MHVGLLGKLRRLGFEKACWMARQASRCQQAFSKPCLVNLISKDTHLVFSIYWICLNRGTVHNNNFYFKQFIFKQCRSRSAGFWWSKLIRIHTISSICWIQSYVKVLCPAHLLGKSNYMTKISFLFLFVNKKKYCAYLTTKVHLLLNANKKSFIIHWAEVISGHLTFLCLYRG